jgi:IS5 family transposase
MRFLGLGVTNKVPDAKTIRAFRERLTRAGAIEALFARFNGAIREAGCIPMAGQIVDASLVSAPRRAAPEEHGRR